MTPLVIFTTRPDTLWGATFMVLAPEHPLVDTMTTAEFRSVVAAYKSEAARMDEIQRAPPDKEKTGVFTGGYASNPVNGEHIPIWIADYVMMGYGTGAIMAVPGARRARLCLCHEVRAGDPPRDHRAGWGDRRAGRGLRLEARGRADQLRPVRRHAGGRRRGQGHRVAGSAKPGAWPPSTTACATG